MAFAAGNLYLCIENATENYGNICRIHMYTHTHTSIVNKFTWTTQEANQEQTPNWGWFRSAVSAALDILSILGRAAREY